MTSDIVRFRRDLRRKKYLPSQEWVSPVLSSRRKGSDGVWARSREVRRRLRRHIPFLYAASVRCHRTFTASGYEIRVRPHRMSGLTGAAAAASKQAAFHAHTHKTEGNRNRKETKKANAGRTTQDLWMILINRRGEVSGYRGPQKVANRPRDPLTTVSSKFRGFAPDDGESFVFFSILLYVRYRILTLSERPVNEPLSNSRRFRAESRENIGD